jgi:para-aminobenzoate synthetase component 1
MRGRLVEEISFPSNGFLPTASAAGSNAVWLESQERATGGDRWSFLAWDPQRVLEWTPRGGWISRRGSSARELVRDPWRGLEQAIAFEPAGHEEEQARGDLPPFRGGAVGYFAYELATTTERLPALELRDPAVPMARWAMADVVFALDHQMQRAFVCSSGRPEHGRDAGRRAHERLESARAWWRDALVRESAHAERPGAHPATGRPAILGDLPPLAERFEASLDRAEYGRRFARLHDYLVAGDLYQANLTVSFSAGRELEPAALFRALRETSPAPRAALLAGEAFSVVSASPELFLARRGRRLVTRPIKGTRRRGRDVAQDEALARELVASPKDMAEHVMIVDVHRNDLGRVSRFGSVRVPAPWALESFATVHHLTSTIVSEEEPGLPPLESVRAAFPAGSITGAPKVRAMEVLAELEPHARGVYTGAVGWIGDDGDFDLSVAIRTATLRDDRVTFPAGGGIVLDSDVDAEYREAWEKARGLWAAIETAASAHARHA